MRPQHYINIVLLALAATAGVAGLLGDALIRTFLYNPWLNGVIGFVFAIGVIYAILRIWRLRPELRWLERFSQEQPERLPAEAPRLLAPLATLLAGRGAGDGSRLTTTSVRYMLDSVESRLAEQRDNARYLTGLLIFLGLLGTFWGLLQTLGAVADVIAGLSLEGDMVESFGNLQDGLARPLGGMGTAFSSSLFGLAGSLVLGFLDLQANRAQASFFDHLEAWLSSRTQLTSASDGGPVEALGGRPMPVYVQALLEQNVEASEELLRRLVDGEELRRGTETALVELARQLDRLAQQLAEERRQLDQFVDCTRSIERSLARQRDEGLTLDATSRALLANLDQSVQRLADDTIRGREHGLDTLRREIRLITRTIAVAAGEPDPGVSRAEG